MRGSATFVFVLFGIAQCSLRTDQQYWKELAQYDLEKALQAEWELRPAQNVILFVGDGMGPNTVTAARIHRGGESHRLAFEEFPHVGLLKTYSADHQVPDSACTATAIFCGVKTNQDTAGVDASVKYGDCDASLQSAARLQSLAALALQAGKSAGLVTTTRVTHATPAPLYAHSSSRKWECESTMPADAAKCKDIARQLVEDWPGKDLQVIMGGGRQMLVSNITGTDSDPLDTWSGHSLDGRDLIADYRTDKQSRGLNYAVVSNNKELGALNVNDTDYVLGIFANGHLAYEHARDRGPEGMPSLADMTEAAIKVLRKNQKGYFLMIEGGNIDQAHHRGHARIAISETLALDDAVQRALSLVDSKKTLVIVTADHTHTLTINGYPKRGADIFGQLRSPPVYTRVAGTSENDGINYTTLAYGTGGPGAMQYSVIDNQAVRRDASLDDTTSYEYEQIAAIVLDENSHGGGDVAIYAKGPSARLFHSVHEQHYVFEAIAYAAKIGHHSTNGAGAARSSVVICIIVLSLFGAT